MEYKIIKNYRNNDYLRNSFNNLSNITFGLDFECWYQNGYWNDNYIPYSIFLDGKIVSNVSVNIIDCLVGNKIEHYVQLGTVMTEENYRNKGFIRILIDEISRDYEEKTDAMFLFANDSVLDFYPKFGFRKATESQYVKSVKITADAAVRNVPMQNKADWDKLKTVIDSSTPNGSFEMINNSDLIMFYLTSFMQNCVYHLERENAYCIAECNGDELLLYNVFSKNKVDIDKIIAAFGRNIKRVKLGFTPFCADKFKKIQLNEEDCTLFVRGKAFENFSDENKMFPLLAHA